MNSNAIQMFAIAFAGLFVVCIVICMYLISIYYDVKELQKSLATLKRLRKDKYDCCNRITSGNSQFQVSSEGLINRQKQQSNYTSNKVKDE